MPPPIVVRTFEEEDIAFLLFHFATDADAFGALHGTCVFMMGVRNPTLFKHPLIDWVYEHKFADEHICVLKRQGEIDEYLISKSGSKPLLVRLIDGVGEVIDKESEEAFARAAYTEREAK